MAVTLWRNCVNAVKRAFRMNVTPVTASSTGHEVDHHDDHHYDVMHQNYKYYDGISQRAFYTKEFEAVRRSPDYDPRAHAYEIIKDQHPRFKYFLDMHSGKVISDGQRGANVCGWSVGQRRVKYLMQMHGVRDPWNEDGKDVVNVGTFDDPVRHSCRWDTTLIRCHCPVGQFELNPITRLFRDIKTECACGRWHLLLDYRTPILV